LPAYVQHDLFEAAVRSAGRGAREELAVFLHRRHPRTTDGEDSGRRVHEPDSLGAEPERFAAGDGVGSPLCPEGWLLPSLREP
jgi:hypothetical protein